MPPFRKTKAITTEVVVQDMGGKQFVIDAEQGSPRFGFMRALAYITAVNRAEPHFSLICAQTWRERVGIESLGLRFAPRNFAALHGRSCVRRERDQGVRSASQRFVLVRVRPIRAQ